MGKSTKKADDGTTENNAPGRRTRGAAPLTDEEKKARRKQYMANREANMTAAIENAVALNAKVMGATGHESIADQIVALRDVLVDVAAVRANVENSIKNKAFRSSVLTIVAGAETTAQTAWDQALTKIKELETA